MAFISKNFNHNVILKLKMLALISFMYNLLVYSEQVHLKLTVLLECFICHFCSEWMVNQHRDSFASFIGHHDMVSYFSLVENESKARTKFNLMQVRPYSICIPL